jgi:hypothetical protein
MFNSAAIVCSAGFTVRGTGEAAVVRQVHAHPLVRAPADRFYDAPHPPVLLVFNRLGPRAARTTMQQVAALTALTRPHWRGERDEEGVHTDDGKITIVATPLIRCRRVCPDVPGTARIRALAGRMNMTAAAARQLTAGFARRRADLGPLAGPRRGARRTGRR